MSDDVALSSRRRATRDRLLDAAAEVFAELGVQAASVEAVCARAGFTRGAFYSNFASKEELFLDLLQREFDRRARHLEEQVAHIAPRLRERGARLAPAEAAGYITEFFSPERNATSWFVLETEFLLLAMRDPSIAPGYDNLNERFYAGIAGVVERVLAAAGRHFTLPAELAVAILGGEYERALRTSALRGEHAAGGLDELALRISEVLFAITVDATARESTSQESAAGPIEPV